MVEPEVGTGIESGSLGEPSDEEIRKRLETRAQRRKQPKEQRIVQSVAPKRILLIHRWFWPDAPPYASMLRSIGRQLVEDGHDVTVLTAQPSYNAATAGKRRPAVEEIDGIRIVRLKQWREKKSNWLMRGLNMLRFMWQIRRFILRQTKTDHGPFDAITATTMPPVLVAATARRAARKTGALFLYHMMDIYPEIAWVSGMAKKNLITRWLAKVDARNCREAARVIVLSQDMKDALIERGLACGHVVILNNFRLEEFAKEVEEGPNPFKPSSSILPIMKKSWSEFRVLFAGNLGRFQGLEEIVEVVRDLIPDHPELQLHFLGEGVRRKQLEKAAGDLLDDGIFFHGHVPQEIAAAGIAAADISLITLQPGIIRYAYPSKTMTCFCAGTAMLAMLERDSELGRFIREKKAGFVVPFGQREGLTRALIYGLEHPEELRSMGIIAEQVGREEFEADKALPRWSEFFTGLFRT